MKAMLNNLCCRAEAESLACFDLDYFMTLLKSESITDIASAERYFHAFIPSCTAAPLKIDFQLRTLVFFMLLNMYFHILYSFLSPNFTFLDILF